MSARFSLPADKFDKLACPPNHFDGAVASHSASREHVVAPTRSADCLRNACSWRAQDERSLYPGTRHEPPLRRQVRIPFWPPGSNQGVNPVGPVKPRAREFGRENVGGEDGVPLAPGRFRTLSGRCLVASPWRTGGKDTTPRALTLGVAR